MATSRSVAFFNPSDRTLIEYFDERGTLTTREVAADDLIAVPLERS